MQKMNFGMENKNWYNRIGSTQLFESFLFVDFTDYINLA